MLLTPLLAVLFPPSSSSAVTSKDADKEREKEDKERFARQRLVLRIVAELAILSAWPEGVLKGAGEVAKVLKGFVRLHARAGFVGRHALLIT